MSNQSGLSAKGRRLLWIAILLVMGLIVSEVCILSTDKGAEPLVISIEWAWGYLAFVWGGAFLVLMIPCVSRVLWKANDYFKRGCRLAVDFHDFSFRVVMAQLLVSSLLNFLVLSLIFVPTLASSIIPALSVIGAPYCGILSTYPFSLFLWLFAGIAGPGLIYAIRFDRNRIIFSEIEHVISSIQKSCYLAALVASLAIASSFLNILNTCGKPSYFINQYFGAVIPSTFAALAMINYLESKSVKSQSKLVLMVAILFTVFTWLIFLEIFYIVLAILSMSILCWIIVLVYEKKRPGETVR